MGIKLFVKVTLFYQQHPFRGKSFYYISKLDVIVGVKCGMLVMNIFGIKRRIKEDKIFLDEGTPEEIEDMRQRERLMIAKMIKKR